MRKGEFGKRRWNNDSISTFYFKSLHRNTCIPLTRAANPNVIRDPDNKGKDKVVSTIETLDGAELVFKVVCRFMISVLAFLHL